MRYFIDKTFTVRRRRRIDQNRSAFSATATLYTAGLQQMQPEKAQLYEGQIGQLFDIFVDDVYADVKVNDEVVLSDGYTYQIRGKEVIDFGGSPFLNLVGVRKSG